VTGVTPQDGGLRLDIGSDFHFDDVRIGDSVAVNGVCLTAVKVGKNDFSVDVAPETLSKSTLRGAGPGYRVNLERALRLGARLDGHLVTGHVDGIGKVTAKRPVGNALLFSFAVSEALSRYIVEKGSVAVDGISLTVNVCHAKGFEISMIPHTAQVTTLGLKKIGEEVNIETDIIGKYVERFTRLAQGRKEGGPVDKALLARAGFM
jgi:riboflavin synthase